MKKPQLVAALGAGSLVVLGAWLYSCGGGKSGATPGHDAGTTKDGSSNGGDSSNTTTGDSATPPTGDSGTSPTGDSAMTAADTAPMSMPMPIGGDAGNCQEPTASAVSVLMQHKNPSRDGLSVDPMLTNPGGLTRDMTFNGNLAASDQVLAEPLYLANVTPGKDAVFIASESNNIYSLDSATGVPNAGWPVTVGMPVDQGSLPCGGGINTYGITSTPVIDAVAGVIYAESFYLNNGAPSHQVVALSVTTGQALPGWPVQINGTTVPGFTPIVEHARGALALVNGILYVPYSGLNGDCNSAQNVPYHGGIVGIDTASPTTIKSWFTSASWGGSWGTGGVASDGTNVYLTTGNTTGANGTWGGGEAVLRFTSGPAFSNQTADYFAPHNWPDLDNSDTDLGSSAAIVLDVPGATPSTMLFAAGKEGNGFLISLANMGGIGTDNGGTVVDGLAHAAVSGGEVKTAFAAYTTPTASYVVLHGDGTGAGCPNGQSGELVAVKVSATNPPTLSTAWCANSNGNGSPIVTQSGCPSKAVVWVVGATSGNQLYGFDGDLGTPIYTGGGANEQMQNLEHWISPMEAGGRIFVASDGLVYAFK